MSSTVCPFCGVASESPHETQQTCIDALHAEISRTRQVLTRVSEPMVRPAPEPGEVREEDRPRT